MKLSDFSTQTQKAIEKFKKEFWKKVEAVPCFNDTTKMFDPNRSDFIIGLIDGYLIFHGVKGEEIGEAFKFIVRQNFYSKRYEELIQEWRKEEKEEMEKIKGKGEKSN